jgi:hypothetical protein
MNGLMAVIDLVCHCVILTLLSYFRQDESTPSLETSLGFRDAVPRVRRSCGQLSTVETFRFIRSIPSTCPPIQTWRNRNSNNV